jgi:arginase family enzyme
LSEQQAVGIAHLIALGGEHGITLPLLRALAKRLDRLLGLVHFDAHVDTWAGNFGQRYAHRDDSVGVPRAGRRGAARKRVRARVMRGMSRGAAASEENYCIGGALSHIRRLRFARVKRVR